MRNHWDMPTERLSERHFDKMLGQMLRSSCEPVPADFTFRMLRQVRESQERKILARVVLQQRLALAGCVALLVVAVLAPILLSEPVAGILQGKAADFSQQCRILLDRIPPAIEGIWLQWPAYAIMGVAFCFAVYSLVGLFFSDKSKSLLILES